ncbi:SH3 domain-containing protein [Streptomyces sp. NBC_00199]|uniref:SH3 domain-containing protein n=1 Tax=Streptomyces sp. NBC_00199 TaxID=2975678 RepID=UPI002258B396|nr:SH3 domain-containing protein [Streptomyces sp. NBC_00199]MCX5266311.1 SH3 domain-containing protein [Streptomyces sp. NBC_00199]
MRTTVALRTLAAALLAGGSLAVAASGATAAPAPPTSGGGDDPVRGTVVSRTELNVRQEPTTHAPVVAALAPGSHDLVQCMVKGQSVDGNPDWYWLYGAQGWASAAFVDVGRAHVPACADPCPRWKDGDWTNWNDPFTDSSFAASGSGSFSFSGTWSFSVSGTSEASSDGWEWVPAGR